MDRRESDSSVVHSCPKKPWIPAGSVAYEGRFMGFNGTEAAKIGDIHGIFMEFHQQNSGYLGILFDLMLMGLLGLN